MNGQAETNALVSALNFVSCACAVPTAVAVGSAAQHPTVQLRAQGCRMVACKCWSTGVDAAIIGGEGATHPGLTALDARV